MPSWSSAFRYQSQMTRTRIKFCGITRVADAVQAARLGVDAIGLVFAAASPRALSVAQACAIAREVPPLVSLVALFMDDEPDRVHEVECELKPDLLQFHGAESAEFCAGFATPYIKAIPMHGVGDVPSRLAAHPCARGFVFDGHACGTPGGQGKTFDWSCLPAAIDRPLILAGGLNADNVAGAIRRVRPWAVDVASGIESSSGIKDPAKMLAFVQAVNLHQ
jgi:phosphoribosylanthranilate isomerase